MFKITRMFYFKNTPILSKQQHILQLFYLSRIMSNCIQVGTTDIKQPDKINHEQLINLLKSNKVYVIDVREDKELKETGVLPHSVNIPVGEIETALKLPDEQFEAKYGKNKPDFETPLLFSCRSGKRSLQAYNAAVALGYKKSLNYEGGWLDWEAKLKKE